MTFPARFEFFKRAAFSIHNKPTKSSFFTSGARRCHKIRKIAEEVLHRMQPVTHTHSLSSNLIPSSSVIRNNYSIRQSCYTKKHIIHRAKMLFPNIKQFVNDNASVYPHSDIKSTRNGYCCKWLLLESKGGVSMVGQREGRFFTLPTSTIDSYTLQHLIATKQANPLTPEMEDVLDAMGVWGRKINEEWHQRVLSIFARSMELRKSRKKLCKECIEVRVLDIILSWTVMHPRLSQTMLIEWNLCYDNLFEHRTRCFYEICIRVFNCMESCVRRAMWFGVVTPCVNSDSSSEGEATSDLPLVVSSVVSSSDCE